MKYVQYLGNVLVVVGKVWGVQIRKIDDSASGSNVLVSTSKVTILCNRQVSQAHKDYEYTIKKYAKL